MADPQEPTGALSRPTRKLLGIGKVGHAQNRSRQRARVQDDSNTGIFSGIGNVVSEFVVIANYIVMPQTSM